MTRSIELFFQEQPSDKVYNVAIVCEDDDHYTVRVEWGRRGSKLSTGTKAVKVSLAAAEKAFDKVVKQKTKKGYEVVTADHQPAQVAPEAGEGSASKVAGDQRQRHGPKAQLLNSVAVDKLDAVLGDDAFVAQQKLDGMRVLVHIGDSETVATNRNSEITTDSKALAICKTLSKALAGEEPGSTFDGELVSAKETIYWIFDLLSDGQDDLRDRPYRERYARLGQLAAKLSSEEIRLVPTAESTTEKRQLLETLESMSAEGIVFKRADAQYTSGRPSSGGDQLKHKFIKTADVVITENVGNAYQMAVIADDVLRSIGKVFAGTTNASRAELDRQLGAGEQPIAEVKYLYATTDMVLFQPVFVRLRDDKVSGECLIDQLEQTDRGGLESI